MKNKFSIAMTLAVIMAMLVTSIAFADVVTSDVVLASAGNQTFVDLGNVTPGQIVSSATSFQLVCKGSNHADLNNLVTIQFFSVNPSGYLTATNATIGPIPADWADDTNGPDNCANAAMSVLDDNGDSLVTITAPTVAGTYDFSVTYKVSTSGGIDSNDITGSIPAVTFRLTVVANTPPTLNLPGNITAEATSASGAVVTYSAAATDVEDNPDPTPSCSHASGSTFALGTTTVNCSVTDLGGLSASGSFTVSVQDTTPPSMSLPSDITAEATGPSGAVVNYSASANDLVDGAVAVSCSPASGSTFALGTTPVSCSVTDARGNSASGSFNVTVQDTTPPTITLFSRLPAANGNGWNNSDVAVTWSCTDLVGVVSALVSQTVSTEGAGQSATGTCTDTSGNSASATVNDINIDKTAPTVSASVSPAPNANGWNNTDVTVSFSGSDGLSGIASCSSPVTLSSEGAGQSASGSCIDLAGNSASATASGINIDKTAPSVSLVGSPADGGVYYFGFVPAASTCSASDVLSGLDGVCSVSGYGTGVGSHIIIASALDKAGNSASVSVSYTVLPWELKGFYQPVDMGKLNIAKNGSTVPLKFEVFAGLTELTNTSIVSTFVQKLTCGTGIATDDIENYATGGTSLRYDTIGGQFIFNWQTPKLAGSCYRVTLTTADGSYISADFRLK